MEIVIHILSILEKRCPFLVSCDTLSITHCNTLQHTATHCNTLQHTATHTHCNTLQNTITHCNTLHNICTNSVSRDTLSTTYCNTLQHTATHTHCNTLQHTIILQHTAHFLYKSCVARHTADNILQHTATHCNTLQHTATHSTFPVQILCNVTHCREEPYIFCDVGLLSLCYTFCVAAFCVTVFCVVYMFCVAVLHTIEKSRTFSEYMTTYEYTLRTYILIFIGNLEIAVTYSHVRMYCAILHTHECMTRDDCILRAHEFVTRNH